MSTYTLCFYGEKNQLICKLSPNTRLTHNPGILSNSVATDETPQIAVSHLGLYCLRTGISWKNENILLIPLRIKVDASK